MCEEGPRRPQLRRAASGSHFEPAASAGSAEGFGAICVRLVSALQRAVEGIEQTVTPFLHNLAGTEGKLVALDTRFKTFDSMLQKIGRDVYRANLKHLEAKKTGGGREQEEKDDNEIVAGCVWKVSDALRYTIVFDVSIYTKSVLHAVSTLNANGFASVSLKNYWGDDDGYQGFLIYRNALMIHQLIYTISIRFQRRVLVSLRRISTWIRSI